MLYTELHWWQHVSAMFLVRRLLLQKWGCITNQRFRRCSRPCHARARFNFVFVLLYLKSMSCFRRQSISGRPERGNASRPFHHPGGLLQFFLLQNCLVKKLSVQSFSPSYTNLHITNFETFISICRKQKIQILRKLARFCRIFVLFEKLWDGWPQTWQVWQFRRRPSQRHTWM